MCIRDSSDVIRFLGQDNRRINEITFRFIILPAQNYFCVGGSLCIIYRPSFSGLSHLFPDKHHVLFPQSYNRLRKAAADNIVLKPANENVVEVWEEDGQDVWLEHWIEDFLDEDSGEVVPVQRHEWHRVAIEESPWRKEDEQGNHYPYYGDFGQIETDT